MFPHNFLNSLALILTKMLIWKENDSVKYGDFPDQGQLESRFSARSKLRQAPKQTPSSLNRSGSGLRPEPFIQAVSSLMQAVLV